MKESRRKSHSSNNQGISNKDGKPKKLICDYPKINFEQSEDLHICYLFRDGQPPTFTGEVEKSDRYAGKNCKKCIEKICGESVSLISDSF